LSSPLIVQIYNSLSEYAQILEAGGIKSYLWDDPWNISDSLLIMSFFSFFFTEMFTGFTFEYDYFW
jgi:hypothetical protein